MRGDVALHQGIAIRRGLGRVWAGNHAAAALVVQHKSLAQNPAPALGDSTPHHVAAATGCHWHDVADGFGGVGLGAAWLGGQKDGCGLQHGASLHHVHSVNGFRILAYGRCWKQCRLLRRLSLPDAFGLYLL